MKENDLELPGSTELSGQEMKAIYGGGLAPGWWAVIWDAVNNFGDIRQGLSDGYNGTPPRY